MHHEQIWGSKTAIGALGGTLKTFLASMLALAALTSSSVADEQFHCAKPGTVLSFSSGNSITFTGQDGFNCVATNAAGRTVHAFLGLSTSSYFSKFHAEQLFPFKVGNRIEFEHQADNNHAVGSSVLNTTAVFYHDEIRVLRQEHLATKGGSFDTWVIEQHSETVGRSTGPGTWVTTYWWAPDFGYIVKLVEETRLGYGPNRVSELTAITGP